MKFKCSKCHSNNTKSECIKPGTFVSYYKVVCKDCGFVDDIRVSDPM